jgi:hypothetical protein
MVVDPVGTTGHGLVCQHPTMNANHDTSGIGTYKKEAKMIFLEHVIFLEQVIIVNNNLVFNFWAKQKYFRYKTTSTYAQQRGVLKLVHKKIY